MIPTLLTCALVLVALCGCVVASMFIEERDAARRSRRARSLGTGASSPPGPEPAAAAEWEPADTEHGDSGTAHRDEPAETLAVIPGRAAADSAVAVLIAAYVASGGVAARRAAGWITADARCSLEGPLFEPGADLRGRTVAVRRLLELDEDDRCWLTLRDGVDIARGLERHPVTCPTLDGALRLWAATRAAMSAVPHDDLARIVATIDELEPTWTPTTGAALLAPVATQLRAAAVGVGTARIDVRLGTLGDGDDAPSASFAPEVHETV
ncbi:MAG: hypothetical protein M3Y51_11485 [Actinomycetota bacterium]|nr:hypothetical protein [Actinomycetota bacterium]